MPSVPHSPQTKSHRIRRATSADAVELAGLQAMALPEPWPPSDWKAMLEAPHAEAFVAVGCDAALTGFVLARRIVDEAEILAIAVAPLHRRSGIARELLLRLLDELAKDPPCHLFLEVAVENEPAQALYQQLGFEVVGLRPQYYHQAGREPLDARTMALEIGS